MRQKGGVVHGALYEVTDGDLAALDRYEGEPYYYHRIKVRVRDEAGRLVWAMAYKMGGEHGDAATSAGYVARILEGYRDWGIDMSAAWRAGGIQAGCPHTAAEAR